MSGRSIFIFLVGTISITTGIFFNIFNVNTRILSHMVSAYQAQVNQNMLHTGLNIGLRRLTEYPTDRDGLPLFDMEGGKMLIRIVDTTYNGQTVVAVKSYAYTNYGLSDQMLSTAIAFVAKGFIPATVKAPISSNAPIGTLGNLTVDGREHSFSGALVPGAGTNGIWTTKTFSQGGSSDVGGTSSSGVDYIPAQPGNPSIIKTSQTFSGSYPTSPDSAIGGPAVGCPEGTLKSIALSGAGGSQYSNTGWVYTPLRGVTYIELPYGVTWNAPDVTGEGILIVHNPWKNAKITNLTGTFKGILIADDIVHIHAYLLGAVIVLSPTPSEGNCIGNGNGDIYYCSDAIKRATARFGTGGSSSSTSAAPSIGNVIAWYE